MFYYFGAKARLAGRYPSPEHEMVIEPFAGSAGYSCHHHDRKVLLIERDERVVELWHRLRSMTHDEIDRIPTPVLGERATDLLVLTRAASEHSMTSSYITVTTRLLSRWPHLIRRLHEMLPLVQHWEIRQGDYTDAPDVEATWFIDPPYQHKHRGYAFRPDFVELAEWCRSRRGQVIVCEQAGADWLPFEPLVDIVGVNGKRTTEVVWINA